jgi:hypothetical protein
MLKRISAKSLFHGTLSLSPHGVPLRWPASCKDVQHLAMLCSLQLHIVGLRRTSVTGIAFYRWCDAGQPRACLEGFVKIMILEGQHSP